MWGRPCDAADFEHFSALVAEVNEVYGPVEVLVNVAGTFKMSDFADSKPPDWSEMLSANLLTALRRLPRRAAWHARGPLGRHCQFCVDSGRIWFNPTGGRLCGR